MELNQVFNAILSGRAILIAGSGINYGSKNINNEQMPLGTSMAEELYNLAGVLDPDDKTDLQDASNYYIEKNSKAELIAFLQNKLSVGEMSDAARQIYSLPWLREYTTNYDQIPILAANNAVIPITIDSRVSQNKKNSKRQCVYINGYLGNLNESKLDSSFKLTTKSYLSSDGMLNSEWGGGFERRYNSGLCRCNNRSVIRL